MLCSLSTEVCKTPVVCRQTGYLYERRIIEKALSSNGGKCPHTGVDMTLEDLINVRTDDLQSKPPLPSKTDMGSMLQHIQNEWDSRTVEIQQLRKDLHGCRQELATALLRLQATHRMLAKLQKDIESEDDLTTKTATKSSSVKVAEQQQQQQQQQAAIENGTNGTEHDSDNGGKEGTNAAVRKRRRTDLEQKVELPKESNGREDLIKEKQVTTAEVKQEKLDKAREDSDHATRWPDHLLRRVQKLGLEMMSSRKGRVVSSVWASSGDINGMKVSTRCGLSVGDGSVECLCRRGNKQIYVGLANGEIKEVNTESMTLNEGGCRGHDESRGGVRCLWWDEQHAERVISGGGDGKVRVWDCSKWRWEAEMEHNSGIVGLEKHFEGSVCLIGLENGWCWRDLETGKIVSKSGKLGRAGEVDVLKGVRYGSSCIHPDGMMFATGCYDGTVEMWDVGSMTCVNRLGEEVGRGGGLKGIVKDIAMSEKGYYMATCHDGIVDMWDLRKKGVVGRVEMKGEECKGVALDGMGEFGCAVGVGHAVLFMGKKKSKVLGSIALHNDDGGDVEAGWKGWKTTWRGGAVSWGHNAKSLLVGTSGHQPSLIKMTVN